MKESDDHKPFIDRIKAEFDRSVEALDGETASRITRARHRALERAGALRPTWRERQVHRLRRNRGAESLLRQSLLNQ